MKNILGFLSRLFSKKSKTDTLIKGEQQKSLEQKNIEPNITDEKIKFLENLKKIEIGDIIWAKRYNTEEEKKTIEEGHREGPFIVLDKTKNYLLCCYGTGVERANSKYNFEIKKDGYCLSKDTYFNVMDFNFIDEKTFIKFGDKLTEKDKNNFFKKLKSLNFGYYYHNNIKKYFDFTLQLGDVINYKGNKYIITNIHDNKLYCIPIGHKEIELLDVNKIDYSNIVFLDSSIKFKCVKTVSENMLLGILKKQKEYLKNITNSNEPQRGSLVNINNKYYYIYGEEGNEWLLFEVYKLKKENFETIYIGKQKYYTDFNNNLKINKQYINKAEILATNEEIDNIKNIRKNYKKQSKQKRVQKISQTKFIKGDIIESKYSSDEKYLIIKVYDNFYECVVIKELLSKQVIEKCFIKKDEVEELSENGVKEIRWLLSNENFALTLKLHRLPKPNKIK